MKKRYVVRLTLEEHDQLEDLVNRGREAAYRRRHAQVLLLVDEGEHGSGLALSRGERGCPYLEPAQKA